MLTAEAVADLIVVATEVLVGYPYAVRGKANLYVSPAIKSLLLTDGVATNRSLIVKDMAEVPEYLQVALRAREN